MKSLALTWYILSITISVKEQRPQWKYHSWLKKKGKKKSTINIIASRKKLAYHKIIALSLYFIIAWSGWFIIMKNSFVFFIFFFFITNITLSFLLYSSSLYSRSVVEVFITALTYRVIAFYSGKRFKDDVVWWEWFFSRRLWKSFLEPLFSYGCFSYRSISTGNKLLIFISKFFFYAILNFMNIYS